MLNDSNKHLHLDTLRIQKLIREMRSHGWYETGGTIVHPRNTNSFDSWGAALLFAVHQFNTIVGASYE